MGAVGRELAKATYRGAAPPFDACAPPSILVRPRSIFVRPPSLAGPGQPSTGVCMNACISLSRSHKCHNYPTVISVAARGAGVWPTCAQSSSTVLILDSP